MCIKDYYWDLIAITSRLTTLFGVMLLQWIVTRDIDYAKNQRNLIDLYWAIQNTTWAPPQPGVGISACDLGTVAKCIKRESAP